MFLWSGCVSFCCFHVVYMLFCFYFAALFFFFFFFFFFLGYHLSVLIWSDPVEETFVAGGHSSSRLHSSFWQYLSSYNYCLGLFTESFCCLLLPCTALREAN
jgi:hypothetical protein